MPFQMMLRYKDLVRHSRRSYGTRIQYAIPDDVTIQGFSTPFQMMLRYKDLVRHSSTKDPPEMSSLYSLRPVY